MTAAHICRKKHFPKEDTMRSISCEIILAQVSVWGPLLMEIILKNHSCLSEKKEREGRTECSNFTEKKVKLCSLEIVACIFPSSNWPRIAVVCSLLPIPVFSVKEG